MSEIKEKQQLLFVDDDPNAGGLMVRFCEGSSYQCHSYRDPFEALDHFEREGADILVTDLRMPGMTGIELLRRIREQDSELPVIVITAYSSIEDAIEALRLGASDFLRKPFDMDELLLVVGNTLERTRLRRENRLLRRQLQGERQQQGLIGNSPALAQVYSMVEKVADVNCNVIINGESGTGKELAARAIHQLGPDPDSPFIVVDCGALTDTLLESELFGHEKGAFTGATAMRRGLFEAARGGTLFLDEIGNISEAMQIKLLRVIQERQITRVGGVRPIDVAVRVLVATNADLGQMVKEGRFREDLYHRLNVVRIVMPPLRERTTDIPLLVQHFIDRFAAEYQRPVRRFDAESMRKLERQPWPGNIRELRNVVERHVVLASGAEIQFEEAAAESLSNEGLDADRPALAELERRYILKVLAEVGDNRTRAADTLGIDKSTLWRKLQSYGN